MTKFKPNPSAFDFKPSGERHWGPSNPMLRESNQRFAMSNDSRSQIQCRFFQQGRCRNGDSCPYLHENNATSDNSLQRMPNEIPATSTQDKVTRTIRGALVYFEKGATVEKISLPSDFSTVQISQLPQDSTRNYVLDLLRSHNINTPIETEVRITHERDSWSALVKVKDPEFAKTAARKLNPQKASYPAQKLQPTATPIANPIQSDSNTLRVDCCKVHISWHKPYRTVWLNFGNGEIAERVRNKFRDGTYKILNQSVHSNDPDRGEGHHNPLAWTVCLTEVPVSATESDVKKSIYHQNDKPRGIQLGRPTYTADDETCSTKIQSLFTSIGPLDWWEFTPDTAGKRMKASARFQNEDDAREAAVSLDKKPLPFHLTAKLTTQLVHTAKFKVHVKIYEAVQAQLKANIRAWKASHLTYVAYENSSPPKWYLVLKLEGEAEKEVASAQKTITRIISGIVARDSSSILWHPALRKNGALYDHVRQIEKRNGIAIIRNKVKSQLQLYGPEKACQISQSEITKLLRDEASQHFDIQLEDHEFSWALQGGLKKIEKRLGSENIMFDITSTPKRITIIGTTGDYDTATSLIKDKEETKKEISIQDVQDCSVCWNEVEDPVYTECGHVYCLDCFENLCLSAMTQVTATRISCVGDLGRCPKTIGLSELQEHLSSSSFEELLEKSLDSYVQHNPHLFSYCPSPDCGYIYRINAIPKTQMCPSCHVLLCTVCQAQHGSMTCGDYKDISTGGLEALKRLKQAIGIKDCPKCKTPMEKIDGCNHMTCPCGAHICWVCLKTFTAHTDCYDHMNKAHGGIGLNQLQERFG
ncbi:uncharacterized protein F4817DRAFT_354451 [Daldinia loculata]|uniref:uncharacterized protein n=1 Tax=Daldinia loculata TaxID=103429 RepID=UPI0020C48FD1|nr:uncharacterized protein F4817DRAFT_354451 [Daldinia loculata]KAI1641893.1 hypothetical protein F4817DRAFT_354451 [Daldinia loculata]